MQYPSGISATSPSAPWNQTPAPDCLECGGKWSEGGHQPISEMVYICENCQSEFEIKNAESIPEHCQNCGDKDIRQLPCPNEGLDETDYDELMRADAAEMEMEENRLPD